MYTAMVKDPFRKWNRVDTVCALLVDLGCLRWAFLTQILHPYPPNIDNSFHERYAGNHETHLAAEFSPLQAYGVVNTQKL